MCLFTYDNDPEPEERDPAGPLYVPVRPGSAEVAVRMFRTPLGVRTAVGFTTHDRLAETLGADQPWVRLDEAVLRVISAPVGAALVTVDPTLTAPQATGSPAPFTHSVDSVGSVSSVVVSDAEAAGGSVRSTAA